MLIMAVASDVRASRAARCWASCSALACTAVACSSRSWRAAASLAFAAASAALRAALSGASFRVNAAIAVFGETVTIRLLFASAAAAALFLILITIVVSIRIGTNQAIPGWATNAGGILMLALLQVITVGSILTFSLLASRQNLSFLPLRDYSWFVSGVEHLDVPT